MDVRMIASLSLAMLALSLAVAPATTNRPGASDEAMATIRGGDSLHRSLALNVDCSEWQPNKGSNIPASHCWNYDAGVDGMSCIFCENDTLYPYTFPLGGPGNPYEYKGAPDCAGDRFQGLCADLDGNGQYKCEQSIADPIGECEGTINRYGTQSVFPGDPEGPGAGG